MLPPRPILVIPPAEHVEMIRQSLKERGVEGTAKALNLDRLTVLKIGCGCIEIHKLTSLYLEAWCNAQRAA